MSAKKQEMTSESESRAIFDRVVFILEQARNNVVRAVNSDIVPDGYGIFGVVNSLPKRNGIGSAQKNSLLDADNIFRIYRPKRS